MLHDKKSRLIAGVLVALVALAAAGAPRPAFADPACGTHDKPAWCASLTGGVATVGTRNETHEYARAGVEFQGGLPGGLRLAFGGELFGVQDGGRLQFARPETFRAVTVSTSLSKNAGSSFSFGLRAGTTLSVEGGIGAPVDPRLWTARAEVSGRLAAGALKGSLLRLRGGHEGTAGGWAVGADVELPVASGPALVASYDFPLQKPNPALPKPWVIVAGARVALGTWGLSGLFR